MKEFAKQLVLPNKKYFTLVDNYQARKIVEPTGVVRLEVIEAHNLLKADVGLFGMRKSDPYVDIRICNQDFRTPTISNTVNPKWNHLCEALIYGNAYMQMINMQVLDEDKGSKDDFLGEIEFKIETIAQKGVVEARLNLVKTITGQIHFRATWLELSRAKEDMPAAVTSTTNSRSKANKGNDQQQESVACIFVYLDSAKNIPSVSSKLLNEPSTQVIFTLGKDRQKSKVAALTTQPVWEEHFHFMLTQFNPLQELNIEVVESQKNVKLGTVCVSMATLVELKDMTYSNPTFSSKYSDNFGLHATVQLYFLRPRPSALPNQVEMICEEELPPTDQTDRLPTIEAMVMNTVEAVARTGGIEENFIELSQHDRQHMKNGTANEQQFSTMEIAIHKDDQEETIEVIIENMR